MHNHDGASENTLRRPPRNLDAERGVLGGILADPRHLFDVAMVLKPGDFFLPQHQAIYETILALSEGGQPIDYITLGDALDRSETFRGVDVIRLIDELDTAAVGGAQTVYHAGIVAEKSRKRQLLEACNDVAEEVYREDGTADELLGRAEGRIFQILDRDTTGQTADASQAAQETLAEFDARLSGESSGVLTFYHDLDRIVHGFQPGQLVLVAARAGVGKSAFATSLVENWLTQLGFPLLFISLEMTRKEVMTRLTSSLAKVDGNLIKDPRRLKISDTEANAVRTNLRELARARLFIDDTPGRTITQIAANARRHRLRHRIELLLIDYLQLVDTEARRGEPRHEQVGRLSRRLKVLARELQIPVIALAQVNRESEKREDRRPRVAELRESGSLEQDADVVLLLHRPELADPDDRPGEAELIVGKNRNGGTGTVKLTYRARFTRFENYAEPAPVITREPEDAPF